ncbi:MAG: restriction endonuclease subunit S [Candidatus Bathyarchaeia archaeon]|jgi:type I restriction enzyme S subunit
MTTLPKDWRIVDFESCIEGDSTPSKIKIKRSDYKEKGKFPIIDQGQEFIAGYSDEISKVFPKEGDSVIFGDHTRIVKFVNFPFCVGADGTKIIRVRKNILIPKFFYYQLRWIPIENAGYSRHYRFLKRKKIIVPPLDYQERIVRILEKADALLVKRKQANLLTNKLLQAVFVQMFRDPKTHDFNVPMKKLKEVSTLITKGESPLWKGDRYQSSGVPIIRIKNIKDFRIVLDDADYITETVHSRMKRSQLHPDDVVISIAGTLGRCAIVTADVCPANMNQDQALVRLRKDLVNPTYVVHALSTDYVREQIENIKRGATRLHLNLKQVGDLRIPLPRLDLQERFVSIVEGINSLRGNQGISTKEIAKLQDSLMSKAFKGKLVTKAYPEKEVTEQKNSSLADFMNIGA